MRTMTHTRSMALFGAAAGVFVLLMTASGASAHEWGSSSAVSPFVDTGQDDGSGGVPRAGTGYLGPGKQAMVRAGMAVPTADKAFFGTDRTTCPPRGQSNDFSRNNPGVCDNY